MELIQNHTSKNTSINKGKFPRIYTHINWSYLRGMRVLDYGCGRYTEHIKKLMWLYDIEWYGYDPYWQIDSLNKEALHCEPDIVLCSNVLNVIKEDLIVSKIHDIIKYKIRPTIGYFIAIYQGNKTGIGRKSKKDCWQRNQFIEEYMLSDEVKKYNIITTSDCLIYLINGGK